MLIKLFVVSHKEELLETVPDKESISKVILQNLDIPAEFKGEALAENRFLLTDKLTTAESEFVGFVSARWDERFPAWPSLDKLGEALEAQKGKLSEKNVLAPSLFRAGRYQVKSWIARQDKVHPGMTRLLLELCQFHNIDLKARGQKTIVMGNNFVLPTAEAQSFLYFWRQSFQFLYEKYGLDFEFDYRCQACGHVSSSGVGRYMRERHAGFLLERVTALYFMSRPDLVPAELTRNELRIVRQPIISRHFGWGLSMWQAVKFIGVRKTTCRDGHR